MRIGQSAGKDYAYILGVYLGDGCVSQGRYFRLNTIDRDFAEAVASSLHRLTGNTATIRTYPEKRSKNDSHQLFLTAHALCERLEADTEQKRVWPSYVWTWGRGDKLQFIVGLMDSEGFVAENSNRTNRRFYMGYKATDPWAADVAKLMESVGIRTGKVSYEKPRKPGYRTPCRFHVKMQSWIDSGAKFNIARKQRRVDVWHEFGPYEQRARFPRRSFSEANMPDARDSG